MFFQKQKEDFWRSVTALGDAWFYFALVLILFALGKTKFAIELTCGFFIIYFTAIIIRLFYFKNRPKKEAYHTLLERIDASSFPSVHSARAVLIALQFSKLSDSTLTVIILFTIASLVCYSRIKIKKHDWIDVIGGIVLGLIAFVAVNKIFNTMMLL